MNPTEGAALISICAFGGVLVCLEAGYRFAVSRGYPTAHEGVGAVEASVFALLGLLLGFSFAGASSRLDTRRQLIVEEANAIGTAYLRLDLLPAEAGTEMRNLFREYIDQRLRVYQAVPDMKAAEVEIKKAGEIQSKIWSLAIRALQTEPEGASDKLLLLPALNEMFDVTTSRTALLYVNIPGLILGLLVGVSWLSGLLAGYGMSKRGKRSVLHMLVYALTVAGTIYVVVDLDHPRSGLIRVDSSDNPLIELRRAL